MSIKIVTNSTSDIPKELAEELDITIVPEYVVFDNKCYKDRIDITEDQFYDKLINENIQPTTACPSPQDFLDVYNELGKNADGIISIHTSSKLSGTINSAKQAKKTTSAKCPIEVIDSKTISLALGMAVIYAAKMAKDGKGFQEILNAVNALQLRVHVLIMFDTLKYLARGGRVGKAKFLASSLLNVKPLLTIKDGEFAQVLRVHGKDKAKRKLLEFTAGFENIEAICAIHSTNEQEIAQLIKSVTNFPSERVLLGRLGPVIGSHAGPGLLAIAVQTSR